MGSRKLGICEQTEINRFSPKKNYNMAIWGIDGGNIKEEILSPLGLVCHGGISSSEDGMIYRVYRKTGEFYKDFTQEEFDKIDKNYIRNERKEKLKKIKEAREKI